VAALPLVDGRLVALLGRRVGVPALPTTAAGGDVGVEAGGLPRPGARKGAVGKSASAVALVSSMIVPIVSSAGPGPARLRALRGRSAGGVPT